MDLAMPVQVNCSRFCIAIQAPIMTSMVVSMSAPRSGRSSTNSISAPRTTPRAMASRMLAKKFTPSTMTKKNTM